MTVSNKPFNLSSSWRLVLHDIGVSIANVLRRSDLPADLFARERCSLTSDEYFRLWNAIAAESNDPLVSLRIGSSVSVEAFDAPLFAATCSADLNAALARISQYKRLMAPMALGVAVTDHDTTLRIEFLDKTATPPEALLLLELVFFVQLARIGTRQQVRPLEVLCPVVPKQRREYTQYFGTPVRRGDVPTLRFSAADASRPFLTANEGMWRFFEKDLKRRLADLDQAASVEERVRAALLELLPGGGATIDSVAKKLGTSGRTLQRRLKAESLSFQNVLDHTREALARHYLKTSAMTGAEISFLLGYEDPNSFVRAFSQWTGTTPERARRDLADAH